MLLNDFQRGKIPHYVKPPGWTEKDEQESAKLEETKEIEAVPVVENEADQTKKEEASDVLISKKSKPEKNETNEKKEKNEKREKKENIVKKDKKPNKILKGNLKKNKI